MQRYLAVLVLVTFGTGCLALQRTPEATVLQSLRTIAVVPIEASGPWQPAPVPTGGAGIGVGSCGLGGLGCVGLVGVVAAALVVYGIYRLADAVVDPARLTPVAASLDGTPTVEPGQTGAQRMLTVSLAKAAAADLQQHHARTIYLVDGYVRLPRVDAAAAPAVVPSKVDERLLRWYAEEVTRTDYRGLGVDGVDAILEVGTYLYEYDAQGRLDKLGVMVRLVDPTTKQVLGRAKAWRSMLFRVLKPMWPGQREKAVGRELVVQCLTDLGLVAE